MAHPDIPFAKMTGAGNDFVLLDNRPESMAYDWAALAPALCDRRYGIGADGLLVLRASSGEEDFGMEYYNSDGSHGGMCGNGGRCAALFAMDTDQCDEVAFLAVGHLYRAQRLSPTEIRLQMRDIASVTLDTEITLDDQRVKAHFVDSGTAHVVLWYDDLPESLKQGFETMDIERIGRIIRYHANYSPGGTNVNLVRPLDASTIAMRTYERGVEGETLACGTGSVASAVVAHALKKYPQEINIITRSHERLCVSFALKSGIYKDVALSGPAKVVFSGRVNLNDLRTP